MEEEDCMEVVGNLAREGKKVNVATRLDEVTRADTEPCGAVYIPRASFEAFERLSLKDGELREKFARTKIHATCWFPDDEAIAIELNMTKKNLFSTDLTEDMWLASEQWDSSFRIPLFFEVIPPFKSREDVWIRLKSLNLDQRRMVVFPDQQSLQSWWDHRDSFRDNIIEMRGD
jgi:hypothetical protein